MTYINNALNSSTLKLTAIKFLNGSSQIGGVLIFDESVGLWLVKGFTKFLAVLPSSRVPSGFGIYNIEARLAGEVL